MIGQIKNNGFINPSFLKSGYANAAIHTEPDFFSMKIDGKEYKVENPEHRQNIKDFLSTGGAEHRETVAAVLHKGIEPTKENLELVHGALNEDPFRQDSEVNVKEELDAEIIEKLDLPPEIRKRIVSSKDLLRTVKTLLSEMDGISVKETRHLSLREALSVLLQRLKVPSPENINPDIIVRDRELVTRLLSGTIDVAADIPARDGRNLYHLDGESAHDVPSSTVYEEEGDAIAGRRDLRAVETLFSFRKGERRKSDFSYDEKTIERDRKDGLRTLPRSPVSRNSGSEDAPIRSAGDNAEIVARPLEERRSSTDAAYSKDALYLGKETASEDAAERPEEEVRFIENLIDQALLMIDSDLRRVFDELEFKTYLVTKVDERMLTAKKEFDEMKSSAIQFLEKGSIAKTIEVLTKSIQKSSFAMLTDMPTEKKLLIGLSRLEEATIALQNKDVQLAEKIVKEVRDLLERIEFKPSSRKIQAMIAQKVVSTEKTLQEKSSSIQDKVLEAIRLHSSGTARDLLELVRFSGANHEIEKYENSSGVGSLKNLKELFSDSSFSAMMSGEQMLNNSDDQRRRDFYVLDIPLQIDEEIAGLKVFVGGKCDENRLDWRNAELYFALKLREAKIALKFSIKDAGVAIEIRGERLSDDHMLRMERLKEPLAEIGYRLLSVRNFSENNSPPSSERRLPLQLGGVQDALVREHPENKFEAKI